MSLMKRTTYHHCLFSKFWNISRRVDGGRSNQKGPQNTATASSCRPHFICDPWNFPFDSNAINTIPDVLLPTYALRNWHPVLPIADPCMRFLQLRASWGQGRHGSRGVVVKLSIKFGEIIHGS